MYATAYLIILQNCVIQYCFNIHINNAFIIVNLINTSLSSYNHGFLMFEHLDSTLLFIVYNVINYNHHITLLMAYKCKLYITVIHLSSPSSPSPKGE